MGMSGLTNHGVGAEGLLAAQSVLAAPEDQLGNDGRVEELWAMKAIEHAEVYFNLLCAVEPSYLKLTGSRESDDNLYSDFRKTFPDLKVEKLTESDLKSESAKAAWREFAERYKDMEDYSLGCLLRLDSSQDYSEENTIIAIRVQFLALEIARNREGHNNGIKGNFKPKPRQPKQSPKEGPKTPSGVNMSEIEYELKQVLSGQHPLLQS